MIDCVHQTRSKSSRNATEHSAVCCSQNQHLPNLSWFQSATLHVNMSFFDTHGMKANGQYYWDILLSKNVSCYQMHCSRNYYFLWKQHIIALRMQHSPAASAKVSVSLLLSYCPLTIHCWTPLITEFLNTAAWANLRVNKTGKTSSFGRVFERSNTAFERQYVTSAILCFTR